jgi:uncharacterized protein (AIM24 family)
MVENNGNMTQQPKVMNANGLNMSKAIGTRSNIEVIQSVSYNGVKVDVLEYQKLLGVQNLNMVSKMWFMEQQNVKVRQLVAYINNDAVRIEAGAMSYFQGPLEMVSGVTVGNAIGKMLKGKLTGESVAQPIYRGNGMLVLEPSFRHFIPFTLDVGETVIVDKGMFYLTSESVKVQAAIQKNLSSGLLGNEGWFQIALTGPGVVILECDVPICEIDIINLNNDVLKVDGSFAVLRSGNLEFSVERSAKTLIGSAVSGEGLVNVYRGTGQVWLAPTLKVYNMLSYGPSDVRAMDMNTSKG